LIYDWIEKPHKQEVIKEVLSLLEQKILEPNSGEAHLTAHRSAQVADQSALDKPFIFSWQTLLSRTCCAQCIWCIAVRACALHVKALSHGLPHKALDWCTP